QVLSLVSFSQAKVHAGESRIHINGLFESLDRLLVLPGQGEGPTGIAADDQREGVILNGTLSFDHSFGVSAFGRQALPIPGVCHGVMRVARKSALKFAL